MFYLWFQKLKRAYCLPLASHFWPSGSEEEGCPDNREKGMVEGKDLSISPQPDSPRIRRYSKLEPLKPPVLISIIIPIYNERQHIEQILERVAAVDIAPNVQKEIIVVDDGSSDGSMELLTTLTQRFQFKLHKSMLNFGKGIAVRTGLKYANGDIILIQDGDLEYNPEEYPQLVNPIIEGLSDVVYGSRFFTRPQGMKVRNYLANRFLTFLANLLYGTRISDEATAYKVFRREIFDQIDLKCRRFEFCPEVTAKISKLGYRIYEVPISYQGRNILEGKKIRFRDGAEAVWALIKYRFMR